jgi:phosphoglycolate phosphatase-like HAD superfamily hydrolase
MTSKRTVTVFFGMSGVLWTRNPGPVEAVETFLFSRHRVRSSDVIGVALRRAVVAHGEESSALPESNWTSTDLPIAILLFRELALDEEADHLARLLCDQDDLSRKWVLAPGAVPAVELLRRARVRMGLFSSMGESFAQTLESTGIRPFIEAIVSPEETGVVKRDAEAVAAALRETHMKAENCWLLGTDRESDLTRAKSAGLKTVLIDPLAQPGRGEGPADWCARRVDEAARLVLDKEGMGSV